MTPYVSLKNAVHHIAKIPRCMLVCELLHFGMRCSSAGYLCESLIVPSSLCNWVKLG